MALLIASSSRAEQFAEVARRLAPELDLRVAPDLGRREDIRYALAWRPEPGLLKTLPNLQLIVSVGRASITFSPIPTCRRCRWYASSIPISPDA